MVGVLRVIGVSELFSRSFVVVIRRGDGFFLRLGVHGCVGQLGWFGSQRFFIGQTLIELEVGDVLSGLEGGDPGFIFLVMVQIVPLLSKTAQISPEPPRGC